jgi:cobalt-zinc-cadmium efflux system protein
LEKAKHTHSVIGGRNLLIAILLNIVITVSQVIGGLIAGSMALLSDAAHNFSDVLSLVISYGANRLSGRQQTLKQTYGYKRAGIFAAFINTSTLLVIASILGWEAVTRLVNPQPISGNIVIYLAASGILFNGLSMLLLKKDAREDMNMRSAYIHMLLDMLTSVAVLAGGFVIKYLGWLWIDGVLSVIIAIYLVYNSWGIFYESIRIFMQFTPSDVDIEKIAEAITSIEGVKNIHHVHVWQLDEHELMFEAHIDVEKDCPISFFEQILENVEEILRKSNIHHFNIQPELSRSDQKELINIGRHR